MDIERYKLIVFDSLSTIKHLDEIYDVNELPSATTVNKESVKWQSGLLESSQSVFLHTLGVVTLMVKRIKNIVWGN